MANLLKYHGLELPVYGPETSIAWGSATVEKATERRADTFVRRMRFRAFGSPSLKEALKVADEGFDYLADRCGGKVVPHKWGLYQTKNNKGQYYTGKPYNDNSKHPNLLPDHHILVAEVAVLRCVSKLNKQQCMEVDTAFLAYKASRKEGELFWAEGGAFQCTNGVLPGETQAQLWIVDVEPILNVSST